MLDGSIALSPHLAREGLLFRWQRLMTSTISLYFRGAEFGLYCLSEGATAC
jgi:hypothetical protein